MPSRKISVTSLGGFAVLEGELFCPNGVNEKRLLHLYIRHIDADDVKTLEDDFTVERFLLAMAILLAKLNTSADIVNMESAPLMSQKGTDYCLTYRDDYRGIVIHPKGLEPKDLDDMTWDNPFSIELIISQFSTAYL